MLDSLATRARGSDIEEKVQRMLRGLELYCIEYHSLPHTNASIPKQPARKSHAPAPPSAGDMTRPCSLGKACSFSVLRGGHDGIAVKSISGFGEIGSCLS